MKIARHIAEDERLLVSLQQGDETAFVCIFRYYYPALFNYCSRIVHDTEVVHDIVQEVFCRLYENRASMIAISSLKSYLYKAVYNSSLDMIRHQKVVNNYLQGEAMEVYLTQVVQLPEVEMSMHHEDLKHILQDAINTLPARCREIFCMSKLEGFSNKQIAEQLDISIKTVENQMTSAFARLRKELEWFLLFFFFINQ